MPDCPIFTRAKNKFPSWDFNNFAVTTTYSQTVQPNKSPYKYETIVKTLIQLESGDWENFTNKIKASFKIHQLNQWILLKTKRNHPPKHRPEWGKLLKMRKRQ